MSLNIFQRTKLLLGEDGFQRLRQAHVAVIGCGAVGGFAVEALARAGVGKLTLVDGDTVEESNINRQLCALKSTLNQNKTEILKKRIQDICSETQVQTYSVFLTSDNADELLGDTPDFVVDAIDILRDKIALISFLQKKKIPFISAMGAARKTDWRQIKVGPLNQTKVCPLAAQVCKALKKQAADLSFPCVYSTEVPLNAQNPGREMGSLVTITGAFGLIIANEVILRIARHV